MASRAVVFGLQDSEQNDGGDTSVMRKGKKPIGGGRKVLDTRRCINRAARKGRVLGPNKEHSWFLALRDGRRARSITLIKCRLEAFQVVLENVWEMNNEGKLKAKARYKFGIGGLLHNFSANRFQVQHDGTFQNGEDSGSGLGASASVAHAAD
ncbi:hypothetical protein LR48_Vigan07g262600 [Vigna angularis]|uniref:Uncharacterized protein n=1 Tax=Phaseolus angularis TaxID=3914 RepID=A0A0L9V228_PHAAN|nr:hypothetical protein LR48_Vigan07g262600 [Vigna angularis]